MSDKAKHLHLIRNDKFTEAFIDFINKNFNPEEHLFLITGGGSDADKIYRYKNAIKVFHNIQSVFIILIKMLQCKKIFLHGLFNPNLVLVLFLFRTVLKKAYWVVWGADLYWYQMRPQGIISNIYEYMRRCVVRDIDTLITHVRGDYELARLWYGAKGEHFYSFMYPSNLYKEYDLANLSQDTETVYIQVGNSADPTNNHFQVLNSLNRFKAENIKIICPLSYGISDYKEKVIKEGDRLFGDKFYPIVDFMSLEKYLEILSKIDIAIFNHNRQQAMGNITTLLGLGKKVYIKRDTTSAKFFDNLGIDIYSFSDVTTFEDLVTDAKIVNLNNIHKIKNLFSEKNLQIQLEILFS